MTKTMQGQEGRSASAARLRDERGQTLVEYALIIAVVSLGSLAALGFLSGKIQTLFSKAGNSIENVTVAAGTGTGGTGGGTPPANNTAVTGTGIPTGGGGSQWFGPGTMTSGPPGLTGLQGVYTNSTPSSSTCSFTLPNGFTYTGVWLREADNNDWDGTGVSGDYEFACIANPSFTPPSNGTDMEGTTLSGGSDGAEYFAAGAGVGVNNPSPSPSPAGAWDDNQGGAGTWFYYPDGGGGSGVLICTWHETSPGNSAYDFPGPSNIYDDYCN